MNRIRAFYLGVRLELAFLVLVYVFLRVSRYEFHLSDGSFLVFDRWTTKVDRARLTHEPFVKEPSARINSSSP